MKWDVEQDTARKMDLVETFQSVIGMKKIKRAIASGFENATVTSTTGRTVTGIISVKEWKTAAGQFIEYTIEVANSKEHMALKLNQVMLVNIHS